MMSHLASIFCLAFSLLYYLYLHSKDQIKKGNEHAHCLLQSAYPLVPSLSQLVANLVKGFTESISLGAYGAELISQSFQAVFFIADSQLHQILKLFIGHAVELLLECYAHVVQPASNLESEMHL